MVAVRGSYDEVNRLCSQLIEERDWAFCNINVRPYYAEGSKTLTFETVEQLGWQLPDEIVIPIASGCQFVRHRRATPRRRSGRRSGRAADPRAAPPPRRSALPAATRSHHR